MVDSSFDTHPRCKVNHSNGNKCERPVIARDCCPLHYNLIFNVKDKRYKLEEGTQ